MTPRLAPLVAILTASTAVATLPMGAALAQATASKVFSAADIDAATFTGSDLAPGRTALTAKVQILLDRSGTSPGVVDGFKGGMSESAIKAFERGAGLPMDGVLDSTVWNLLQAYSSASMIMDYTITAEDGQGLVDAIPTDYAEKAQMASMGYTSIAEKLGERFHMDEKFISFLNPGIDLVPGATIKVTAPAKPIKTKVSRIIVDKSTRRVAAYDASGKMIVDYPATVGSDATPSPAGNHTVVAVALNPNYTYNPKVNFKQGDNDKVLTVPPGPNGPVGNVWIDLSKPTYGIHGTPTPSKLFVNQSNGCVRLTNWDAQELANMVQPGVTTVEFLEPGVTIADVTGGGAPRAVPAAVDPVLPATTAATAIAADVTTADPGSQATPLPQAATAPLPDAITAPLPEDTTEHEGEAPATTTPVPLPPSDPLTDALNNALPEGTVLPVPPVTENP